MTNLAQRSIAGAVMILVALEAAWLGGYFLAGLAGVTACVMFYEWRRLVAGWGVIWVTAGFVYALVPALALLWVRERGGFDLLVWVFITTWSTDIGAYFAGRAIGGPRLAPSISPNKTISGLVGGLVAAGLLGGLWAWHANLDLPFRWLAPLFALAAQGGDLFESWLKRRAGVKDSGNILPGHGGALDRLDGLVVVVTLTALATLMVWL